MHMCGGWGQRSASPQPQKRPSQPSAEGLTCALCGIVLAGATLPVAPGAGPAPLGGGGPATCPSPVGLPQARVTGRPRSPWAPGAVRCARKTESCALGGPGGPACWAWSRRVRAAHLGTWRGWGRSRSGAGARPPLPPQGTGTLRAEERDRRRPWSGSLSGPCRAGSRLSTPTTGTSCQAL